MRIAIIGPAHPYKGGIAQHTTELAHRLTAAGHDVDLISWDKQYAFFYPGKQFVPHDQPELPPHPSTRRVLSWRNPVGWGRWGRRLRGYDRIVFIWWIPTFQGPPYLSMLKAMGKNRPPAIIVCHNVLPHEARLGDRVLARAVLRRCQRIIVHSPAQAEAAAELAGKQAVALELPLILPKPPARQSRQGVTKDLLFFGFVRPYKGLDILLQALEKAPGIKLTVAGEFWGDTKQYDELIERHGLADRVTVHSGYVPIGDLAKYISAADAVVLPYKSGTGSWNVQLAHAYGTPVIATTAGSLGSQVRDGIDGLLCQPNSPEALAKAINCFYEPGAAQQLRKGVPPVSPDADWHAYVQAVTSV